MPLTRVSRQAEKQLSAPFQFLGRKKPAMEPMAPTQCPAANSKGALMQTRLAADLRAVCDANPKGCYFVRV